VTRCHEVSHASLPIFACPLTVSAYAEAATPEPAEADWKQPLPLLLQTLGAYVEDTEASSDLFKELLPYFTQVPITAGQTMWKQGDPADALYLIEIGSLRATYAYDDHRRLVQETMVAGTMAGDLSTLSDTPRNATVMAERDGLLWKLDKEALRSLEKARPDVAREFIHIVLKGEWRRSVSGSWKERNEAETCQLAVAEEQDVLASHLITEVC
jgi:SulP family sulfate permease